MNRLSALCHICLVAIVMVVPSVSLAQVPPHRPGTVCATPQFWCWAPYPGPPGTRCACASQAGWVQGTLI